MKLTPEERKKIYEEEKAKEEKKAAKSSTTTSTTTETTTDLNPNLAGLLCYLFGWVTGIVFLILEQKNQWIRFHAAQSIVVFGFLSIVTAILGWIPIVGWIFSVIIWIFGFVLWILLMFKAYNGERYKLPLAGDLAENIISSSRNTL